VRVSKAESDTSFEVFMDQAGPGLLRTAWFLTGDVDRAQELTQATLVKTYVVWHKIDHHTARAYARRCLVNHKIDVWRATRHEVAEATSEGHERPPGSWTESSSSHHDATAGVDHRDDLARRLSRLSRLCDHPSTPARCRGVLRRGRGPGGDRGNADVAAPQHSNPSTSDPYDRAHRDLPLSRGSASVDR
jgi:hypothetical protein